MRIESRGIDPASGRPDPHGIPQIACPARREEVNPQFTCLGCPCASSLEFHEAVDDRGLPFQVVDAVECDYREGEAALEVARQTFPNALGAAGRGVGTLSRPAVACPLLRRAERTAPLAVEVGGARWAPVSGCRSCQFFRGSHGIIVAEQETDSRGEAAPAAVVCAALRAE